jgi:hypothetical protein
MSKPFIIVSSELDKEFQIYTSRNEFVALAPTAKPHSGASWVNKTISPKALWESVSTEQERKAINEVLDEPGLTRAMAMIKLADLQIEFCSSPKLGRSHARSDEAQTPCP